MTLCRIYKILGDNVAVVLFDYVKESVPYRIAFPVLKRSRIPIRRICLQEDRDCLQSSENPDGVPEWKVFLW